VAPKGDLLLTTVNDGIAEIWFNHPDALSALSMGSANAFAEAVGQIMSH
jgi:enoyl-CoA hydratase/carnithine racemase